MKNIEKIYLLIMVITYFSGFSMYVCDFPFIPYGQYWVNSMIIEWIIFIAYKLFKK